MSDYKPGDYQSGEDRKVSKLDHHNTKPEKDKNSPFCIVYSLETERNKRQEYKNLRGPELWEAMVNFLEQNPVPISDKRTLEKGVHIFTCVFNTASTPEMKKIAQDYINLFHKEMITV